MLTAITADYKNAASKKSSKMAKMNPREYIETLRPAVERSLAIRKTKRTAVLAATEPPTDGKEQSYVDAGALVSFTNRLSGQNKEDVLNGTLLAQLAADAVADRTKQTEVWYNKYVEVLSHIGWVIQKFSFQRYTMQGQSFSISKALLNIVKDLLTPDEFDLIQRTIDSLKGDDNQPWWHVFSKEASGPSENGNFQVCPCQQDASGQIVMALGSFYFQASETNERWLWFSYHASKMHFFRGTQTCTLNEDVYGQVREMIKSMLGDQAKDYLGGLKLKKKD